MSTRAFVEGLNHRYFDGKLSPDVVDQISSLPVDREDARAFVERVFRFMQAGRYPAHDVSPFQAAMLGSLVARLLPGRWEGRVPRSPWPGDTARSTRSSPIAFRRRRA